MLKRHYPDLSVRKSLEGGILTLLKKILRILKVPRLFMSMRSSINLNFDIGHIDRERKW